MGYCSRRTALAFKRLFDLLVSASVLALFSPLLVLIGLAIKLDDGGPILVFAVETYPVGGNGRVGDGSQPEQWTALCGLIRENPVKQTSPGDVRVITDICGV